MFTRKTKYNSYFQKFKMTILFLSFFHRGLVQNLATSIIETGKQGVCLNYSKAALCSKKCQASGMVDIKKEAQLLSFVGDLKSEFSNSPISIDSNIYQILKQADLVFQSTDSLFSQIGRNQIVIINEAHDRHVQRAFIYQLLPILKQKGFTHLAMETLMSPSNKLDVTTGFYTSEPLMGEVYRKAIDLGFEMVSYEDSNNLDQNRDSIQAVNLKNKLYVDGKLQKTLIVCGYGHLYEWSESVENKMMGQYFTELTGVNPLTIDQVLIGENSENRYTGSIYEALMKNKLIIGSKEHFSTIIPPFSDIYILHPKTEFVHNRPEYFLLGNEKRWIEMNCHHKKTILVQAFLKSEIISENDLNTRIPSDQTTYFENGRFHLALRPNVNYVIVYRKANNKIVKKSPFRFHQ